MTTMKAAGPVGTTRIFETTMGIPASRLGPPSRLPRFRWQQPMSDRATPASISLNEEESRNAYSSGDSVLPYQISDDYDHTPVPATIPVIGMENNSLGLTVAPGLGGRLLRLHDHRQNRDLVFANPVFQPANLGALNAWFSGGIEWNGLIPGHTPISCAPIFTATLETSRGPVLRLYEFDRVLEAVWQIDLFLPADDDRLFVHGRIVNPDDTDKLAFWWTNVAVPLAPGMRVISPADHSIEHVLPANGLARFPFPDPTRFDGSYPHRWLDATSVFFRAPPASRLWTAALDQHGVGLVQVATAAMTGRKFFYFGTASGGQNWMDRLSLPGQGNYIEIQSGMAPTQSQKFLLPAHSEMHWTEGYASLSVDPDSAHRADYQKAVAAAGAAVAGRFPQDELAAVDKFLREVSRQPADRRLSAGAPWGCRDERLTGRRLATGLDFAVPDEAADAWHELVDDGTFDEHSLQSVPADFAVSPRWQQALQRSAEKHGETWLHALALGIAALNQGERAEASALFERSLAIRETWLGYRQRALVAAAPQAVADAYLKAWNAPDAPPELADEIVDSLLKLGRLEALAAYIGILPDHILSRERVVLGRAQVAAELGDVEALEGFLARDFSTIREGEDLLDTLWHALQHHRLRQALRREPTAAELRERLAQYPLPRRLDFRMKIDDTARPAGPSAQEG
jgi:hypothetical protein